jgi:hypothetical protein
MVDLVCAQILEYTQYQWGFLKWLEVIFYLPKKNKKWLEVIFPCISL